METQVDRPAMTTPNTDGRHSTALRSSSIPLHPRLRWFAAITGIATLALLITATQLTPDPNGMGTHQQLGLPPCSSVALFDVPCPACGMTTSWSLVVRARVVEAIEANAGGVILALIAMAYLPLSCYFFLSGRSSRRGWFSWAMAGGIAMGLLTATIQWALRLEDLQL